MNYKYTIILQWSEEDECFVVMLPEFTDVMQPVTHGDTYEEALKNAQEVLELLVDSALEDGETLPEPINFGQSLLKEISEIREVKLEQGATQ